MAETPRLLLPLLAEAQDSPEIPVNLGRYEVDALLQASVIRRDLSAPPGAEQEGDAFIVNAPGSGAWAGHDDQIAAFQGGGYRYYQPHDGWRVWCVAEAKAIRFGVGSPSTWTIDQGELEVGIPGSPSFVVPGVAQILFTGADVTDLGDGTVLVEVGVTPGGDPLEIQVALSDMTTALTTGVGKAYVRAPRAFTLSEVRASLFAASSSGAPQVDVNVNGSSILSTKLTIDQGEKTSVTAATPAVISAPTIADDDEITFDIDTAGTAAAGLIVTLIGSG